MAATKTSSKTESAVRKAAGALKTTPKSHAVGRKCPRKTAKHPVPADKSKAAPKRAGAPTEPLNEGDVAAAGVGVSPGGMEAFTNFLTHLPYDVGMAVVLAQHPDPPHKNTRFVGAHINIISHKEAESRIVAYQRRLRLLGAKLVVAEQEERRRIAAGLHDNVVQLLLLAKVKLESLSSKSAAARLAPALREALDLIEQAARDTRTLLFDLSPVALYELGFLPAVEALLEEARSERGIVHTLQTDGRPTPMASAVRVILYRAVREALRNAAKHARATHVAVSVHRTNGDIQVAVRDDGVGFGAREALPSKEDGAGFGLPDIRERLEYLGGSLTITSAPGKGTTVALRAPLAEDPARGGDDGH